jgi:hypothetical protein
MLKKILMTIGILILVLVQAYFIYAVQHGGAAAFANVWSSFNVSQTEYSKLVFGSIKWWWVLPALCSLLLVWALVRPKFIHSLATVIVSVTGVVALYWSAYGPDLFIKL